MKEVYAGAVIAGASLSFLAFSLLVKTPEKNNLIATGAHSAFVLLLTISSVAIQDPSSQQTVPTELKKHPSN